MSKALEPFDSKVFQNSDIEKALLKKAKRIYKENMVKQFGKDWKKSGYSNVSNSLLDENKYKNDGGLR